MDEVDESVTIIVNGVGTAVDIAKELLMAVTSLASNFVNGRSGGSVGADGEKKPGLLKRPLIAATNLLKKYIPNIGSDGQIRMSTLGKLDGDNVCVGQFQDKELKLLKQQFKKHGIEFAAIKLKGTDAYDIMIKAGQSQVANHVIENVIRQSGLLSEQEINECVNQEFIDEDVLKENPKMLTEARSVIELEGNKWSLVHDDPDKDNLLYKTEYGKYDLIAKSDGNWRVTSMGQDVDYGKSVAGLNGAMLDARIASDVANKPEKAKINIKDVKWSDPKQVKEVIEQAKEDRAEKKVMKADARAEAKVQKIQTKAEKKIAKVRTPQEENRRAAKLSSAINNNLKNAQSHEQNRKNNQQQKSSSKRR